jgi:GTP pyrophosphokinase
MDKNLKLYYTEIDTKDPMIKSALKFAYQAHLNQFRKSGEPYISHCIEVYRILKSWGVENRDLLIASLLHDVIEDSHINKKLIKERFGSEVYKFVEGVTQIKLGEYNERDSNTLKKIMHNSLLDPNISILKLADRIHNLSTLQYMPADKRERKAKESLEVYAKLAESLGLWVIKTEIEDLSFKYLLFERYSQVKTAVDNDERLSKNEVENWIKKIKTILFDKKIRGEINIKKSGYFHAYQKLKQYSVRGISSNENYRKINDIVSYRVVVKSVEECYKTLYAIHEELGDLVDYDRFDEFIGSNKRINGYEALQTTIDTNFGSIEIAIVTEDMENFNNWGYLYNLKKDIKHPGYNLKLLFTPEYDLIFLPENARAIDFAYAVNNKLGDNSINVEIDGEIKGLDYILENTDTVKVITGNRSKELDEYLSTVCLPITKNLIQKKLINDERLKSISEGENILEDHLSPRGVFDLRDITENVIGEVTYAIGCENIDELYYRVAKGYLNIEKLDNLLNEYGITKSNLKWTSIKIKGYDKSGMLKIITDVISEYNGNILKINYQREKKDKNSDYFYLRIVVENIKLDEIENFRNDLQKKVSLIELKVA